MHCFILIQWSDEILYLVLQQVFQIHSGKMQMMPFQICKVQ